MILQRLHIFKRMFIEQRCLTKGAEKWKKLTGLWDNTITSTLIFTFYGKGCKHKFYGRQPCVLKLHRYSKL